MVDARHRTFGKVHGMWRPRCGPRTAAGTWSADILPHEARTGRGPAPGGGTVRRAGVTVSLLGRSGTAGRSVSRHRRGLRIQDGRQRSTTRTPDARIASRIRPFSEPFETEMGGMADWESRSLSVGPATAFTGPLMQKLRISGEAKYSIGNRVDATIIATCAARRGLDFSGDRFVNHVNV